MTSHELEILCHSYSCDRQAVCIWKISTEVFIFAPCILISSKSFIYQQVHFIWVLENIKIYIKSY